MKTLSYYLQETTEIDISMIDGWPPDDFAGYCTSRGNVYAKMFYSCKNRNLLNRKLLQLGSKD